MPVGVDGFPTRVSIHSSRAIIILWAITPGKAGTTLPSLRRRTISKTGALTPSNAGDVAVRDVSMLRSVSAIRHVGTHHARIWNALGGSGRISGSATRIT